VWGTIAFSGRIFPHFFLERKMAMISKTATLAARRVARDVVRRRFGETWGSCRQAALAANLDDPSRVDADRRFLQTVVVESMRGPWQERRLNRLATLLEKMEPGSAVRLAGAVRSKKATQVMNEHRRKSEWAELPDPIELIRIEQQLTSAEWASIESFEEWAQRQGHERWRIRLARRRILAPLVCYARTFGVERGWHELTPREQSQFIETGIARERIMLRVAPAHIRAMERFPTDADSPDLEFTLEALGLPKTSEWKRKVEEQWMLEGRGDWVGSEPPEGLEDEGRRRVHRRPPRWKEIRPAKGSVRRRKHQEPPVPHRDLAEPQCEQCGANLRADVELSGDTISWCPEGCEWSP
jgi:hypothetical protein